MLNSDPWQFDPRVVQVLVGFLKLTSTLQDSLRKGSKDSLRLSARSKWSQVPTSLVKKLPKTKLGSLMTRENRNELYWGEDERGGVGGTQLHCSIAGDRGCRGCVIHFGVPPSIRDTAGREPPRGSLAAARGGWVLKKRGSELNFATLNRDVVLRVRTEYSQLAGVGGAGGLRRASASLALEQQATWTLAKLNIGPGALNCEAKRAKCERGQSGRTVRASTKAASEGAPCTATKRSYIVAGLGEMKQM
ncbi:hypothetical protein B0H10DRAFT_2202203 [Mycena sp. CBHHK59/15]|nr:hypothetical protein B0H10DRAFT_2202203 [Mycena sp. CBHHK59/15]